MLLHFLDIVYAIFVISASKLL